MTSVKLIEDSKQLTYFLARCKPSCLECHDLGVDKIDTLLHQSQEMMRTKAAKCMLGQFNFLVVQTCTVINVHGVDTICVEGGGFEWWEIRERARGIIMTEWDALPKHLEGGFLKIANDSAYRILTEWNNQIENVVDSLVFNAREHVHKYEACRIDRLDDLQSTHCSGKGVQIQLIINMGHLLSNIITHPIWRQYLIYKWGHERNPKVYLFYMKGRKDVWKQLEKGCEE